ncbi:MAG: helix-turn-helix domain-containing protein [Bacillus sp. (in: firmicutes)]
MARMKDQSLKLMKLLSDARRVRILHLASDEPITVKQMAEKLNEQPSRLYYHVKKLEDAELLQVTEIKTLGNLVEKYYQAIDLKNKQITGDIQKQAEQIDLTISLLYRQIEPALKLLQKSLEVVRDEKAKGIELTKIPYQVMFTMMSDVMTAEDWRISMLDFMRSRKNQQEIAEDHILSTLTEEERKQEGTYQYMLLSYRLEDAEKAGITPLLSLDEEV